MIIDPDGMYDQALIDKWAAEDMLERGFGDYNTKMSIKGNKNSNSGVTNKKPKNKVEPGAANETTTKIPDFNSSAGGSTESNETPTESASASEGGTSNPPGKGDGSILRTDKPSPLYKVASSSLGFCKGLFFLDQSSSQNIGFGLSLVNTGLKGFMVYQEYKAGKINPIDATSLGVGTIGIGAKVMSWTPYGGTVAPFVSTAAGYFGVGLTIYTMWSIPYKSMDDLRFAPSYYDLNGEPVWDTSPTDAEIFNDFN